MPSSYAIEAIAITLSVAYELLEDDSRHYDPLSGTLRVIDVGAAQVRALLSW